MKRVVVSKIKKITCCVCGSSDVEYIVAYSETNKSDTRIIKYSCPDHVTPATAVMLKEAGFQV